MSLSTRPSEYGRVPYATKTNACMAGQYSVVALVGRDSCKYTPGIPSMPIKTVHYCYQEEPPAVTVPSTVGYSVPYRSRY